MNQGAPALAIATERPPADRPTTGVRLGSHNGQLSDRPAGELGGLVELAGPAAEPGRFCTLNGMTYRGPAG
jgi:hypothetical protein